MNFLGNISIKQWLGFLLVLLTDQESLRKTPWIDKIFLSTEKRIKQFLDCYSIVSKYEYLLGKINYCFDISWKFFIILLIIASAGDSLKFPSQLVQYIYGAVIVTSIPAALFASLKGILEFRNKFKSFSKIYFGISIFATCSPFLLLILGLKIEAHPLYELLNAFHLVGVSDSAFSISLKISIAISILIMSHYLITSLVVGTLSLMLLTFLYINSKLVQVLIRMVNSNFKAAVTWVSALLCLVPD